jgi:hypothetical protein
MTIYKSSEVGFPFVILKRSRFLNAVGLIIKRNRFLNAVGLNPTKYLNVKVLLKCLKYLEVIKLFCMVCLK